VGVVHSESRVEGPQLGANREESTGGGETTDTQRLFRGVHNTEMLEPESRGEAGFRTDLQRADGPFHDSEQRQMGHLIKKSLLQQQMQQHQMQVTRDQSPSYSKLSTTGPPPDPYAATPYSECPDAAAVSTRTAEEDVMDLLQHRPPVLWDRFAHLSNGPRAHVPVVL